MQLELLQIDNQGWLKANKGHITLSQRTLRLLHGRYLYYYETEAYKVKGCNIKLGNGTEVLGETFIYNGDKNLLKKGRHSTLSSSE